MRGAIMIHLTRTRKSAAHPRASRLLAISILLGLPASATQAAVHYQLLSSFGSAPDDGRTPEAALIVGRDGALYGTTAAGNSLGTVFKMKPDGRGYTVLHGFRGYDGSAPWAALLEGRDGALYGTTFYGGDDNLGTV